MPVDFDKMDVLRELSDSIAKAVDAAIEAEDDEGYRTHLGASVIGNECLRYLFYHFRWMHKEKFDARMIRLFGVGHGLETRVRYWLTKIGFEFVDGLDENQKQLRFSDLYGHFGGSCDGVFIAPKWNILEPTLLECKTSGTGSPFNDLGNKGMRATKEQHFVQNSVYGKGFGLKNVLYMCENKNDSSWYFELLPLDMKVAEDARRKAQFVIFETKQPPKKINQRRNFWLCNMCQMQGICHDGVPTDVNCRSCKHSTPVDNGEWKCNHWNNIIPADFILKGCAEHSPIQP